jgi:hypothetical protein
VERKSCGMSVLVVMSVEEKKKRENRAKKRGEKSEENAPIEKQRERVGKGRENERL